MKRIILVVPLLVAQVFITSAFASRAVLDGVTVWDEAVDTPSSSADAPSTKNAATNVQESAQQSPQQSTTAQANASPASESVLVIYGGNTCPITQQYIKELKAAKVDYTLKDLSNPAIMNEISTKLTAQGFNGATQSPVVELNGKLMVRPALSTLLKTAFKQPAQYHQIVVYSIANDRNTERFTKNLSDLGVPFVFKNSNQPDVNKDLFKRLKEQHIAGSVRLPVVMVNNKLLIQPGVMEIINLARK